MSHSNEAKFLSIGELFIESSDRYLIPLYQRPYAWKSEQIEQLIEDIDYASIKGGNYYLGTLVVYRRLDGDFETIDGQQRLTTLLLILRALELANQADYKIKKDSIIFANRPKSKKTLSVYLENDKNAFEKLGNNLDILIYDAIEIIERKLNVIKKANEGEFEDFLKENVKICRVEVPENTDLNHYFEIMNNRGEQLEMHEIVKARLLDPFQSNEEAIKKLGKIWDACTNMDRYIQKNFKPKPKKIDIKELYRENLFGNEFDTLNLDIFSNLEYTTDGKENAKNNEKEKHEKNIYDYLEEIKNHKIPSYESKGGTQEEKEGDFIPLLDFPNFLLQVLRIFTENKGWKKQEDDLNDKKLLRIFEETLLCDKNKTKENIIEFSKILLILRFFLDNYIIHRGIDPDEDKKRWILKKFKKKVIKKDGKEYITIDTVDSFESENNETNEVHKSHNENHKLIKLLSMYEVTYPGKVRKEWLSGVLRHLYHSSIKEEKIEEPKANEYIEFLEKSAERLLKNYYLNEKRPSLYQIFKDEKEAVEAPKWDLFDQGTNTPNFAFNYLDYLLWRDCGSLFKFDYRYHNSVEHFYPRTPIAGGELPENLDDFGNLYLTSRSINSKLSNHPPQTKVDQYRHTHNKKLPEHPKQKIMYCTAQSEGWSEKEIQEHENVMKDILQNNQVSDENKTEIEKWIRKCKR